MKIARCLILIAILVGSNAVQHAKGNQAGDIIAMQTGGKITFNPPFPMTRHGDPSNGEPISSVTYNADNVHGTNGAARVSFVETSPLWMVDNPASITNRVTTIIELKKLIDEHVYKGLAGTNLSETIIKFQGQHALETSGYHQGSWHDQIIMYWGIPMRRTDNPILIIDTQATKKEICKALVKAVKVDLP
jgi:hypothetical protein